MTYVVVWEFEVRTDVVPEFERLYGPNGGWVALFREAPAYLGTELLRDTRSHIPRYLTIDRWQSREAYDTFRQARADRYRELDAEGERFTTAERFLGDFTLRTERERA